ncbi:hypothetical protein EV144_105240 [Flavobacterium sp. 270]|uniref:hypothetical protein n=1 Tax=Flavobacterium sp. 270 TaxID=2512114 RepID=UPI001065048A|nr:hypothetical protein [Flavobacterium sp. 270]TDW47222.1 hypothetical protein EV144_105240 [Flavobacterium sp. 270]
MKNITLNSPIEKIYPPGTLLPVKLSPDSVGKIKFPERTDRMLLSPLVEAYHTKENQLLVRAVIFIARKETKDLDFGIYQNCYIDLNGNPQLQFFISYDLVETKETDFLIYEVAFNAIDIPYGSLSKISTIQTFLWDIDPVTSRGTVTTVQPA